ncbi:FtsB family cell division protein [Romboutsia lituseburensis]|uniref:FtsB family cell division protein n=1 Tax=Romboutsia lituseburensis TaxID=1537 RepID=UPI00215B3A30|nr:septum formation initiator family protein [Romboutsia lituseburensis]MCR8746043.1 septum formation initiator family protein [Romboutsia lituseburensis]
MNIRKKFFSQAAVLGMFLVFVVCSLGTGVLFQVTKVKEYKKEIASINKQIEHTKAEIAKLEKEESSHDLEISARNRLNMVKPGEIIYVDIKKR